MKQFAIQVARDAANDLHWYLSVAAVAVIAGFGFTLGAFVALKAII